jgi:hypothetical protein
MLRFRASVFVNEVVIQFISLNVEKEVPDRLYGGIRQRQKRLEREPCSRERGRFGFNSTNELRWFWKRPEAKSIPMGRVKTPG